VTQAGGLDPIDEQVPAVVAVGRTVGGILLVLIGIVLGVAALFWYFIVPWFSWTTEGFWYVMGEWADLGGVVLGILGILALIVGGALVQRARKKRLQIFVDSEDIAALQTATGTQKPAPEKPTTIL
jgi:hypothetical protein